MTRAAAVSVKRTVWELTPPEAAVVSRWAVKTAYVLSHAAPLKWAVQSEHLKTIQGKDGPVPAGVFVAVMNAIASAVGVDAFRRAPVTPDVLLMTLEHGKRMHEPLQAHL